MIVAIVLINHLYINIGIQINELVNFCQHFISLELTVLFGFIFFGFIFSHRTLIETSNNFHANKIELNN